MNDEYVMVSLFKREKETKRLWSTAWPFVIHER